MLLRCHRGCKCAKPPSCSIAADAFDRPDGSTIGDDWTEVSGDWAIAGNGLKPPSGGLGDLIKFNTPDPGGADGVRWSTTFNFGGNGEQPGEMKWLVDYVDEDNHHFADVVVAGAGQLAMRIWRRESGSNTQLASTLVSGIDFDVSHTVAVCWGFQGEVPVCSSGKTTWVWTFNPTTETYFWQGRFVTGDCQSVFCISDPPGFDGTLEGQEEETDCYLNPAYSAAEGEPAFRISATLDDETVITAIATPHGGDYVGLGIENANEDFRFDDAVLSRLKRGCPSCNAAPPPCEVGCGGNTPSLWLIEFEGIANVADDPTVCNCEDANRAMLLPASLLPCHWQEYDSAPGWEYCPGNELEGVDGSHIWAGEVWLPDEKQLRLIVRQPNVEAGHIGFGEVVASFDGVVPDENDCDEVERLELFTEADLGAILVDLGLLGEYQICDYTGWRVFISAVA